MALASTHDDPGSDGVSGAAADGLSLPQALTASTNEEMTSDAVMAGQRLAAGGVSVAVRERALWCDSMVLFPFTGR